MILLTPLDLSLSALLIVALALTSVALQLHLTRSIVVSAIRTALQLSVIGLVLKMLFEQLSGAGMAAVMLLMLAVAAREIASRQQRRFAGAWGYLLGTLSMLVSAFAITFLALTTIIRAEPWYAPQYAIPLLGMMLGNTMNGISLGLDRLTQTTWQQRQMIEARLMLGQSWKEAISDVRRESIRSGLIPIINSMAIAGLVSLPGMMTGQILAGSPPAEAVKYQILIMYMIAAGTGFGAIVSVWLGARRLFDARQRLRLDRLVKKG